MSSEEAAGRDHCLVTVCRGCCCGDPGQYPGLDHEGLIADLRRRIPRGTELRRAGCLLKCEDANVVVVSPSSAARSTGASPVWLARVFEQRQNEEIARWIGAGGPGGASLPSALAEHVTEPFFGRSSAAARGAAAANDVQPDCAAR